jgi:hypothetical protein
MGVAMSLSIIWGVISDSLGSFCISCSARSFCVGGARSNLFSARELLDFALPWMKSVAADRTVAQQLR